jgi:hypothetical protein
MEGSHSGSAAEYYDYRGSFTNLKFVGFLLLVVLCSTSVVCCPDAIYGQRATDNTIA